MLFSLSEENPRFLLPSFMLFSLLIQIARRKAVRCGQDIYGTYACHAILCMWNKCSKK